MLAKLTAKNQLTLPKQLVEAVGVVDYFDVELRSGQLVLTPVRIQRGDAVRAKLAALGLGPGDVAAAVLWARGGGAAAGVAEAPAEYVAVKRTRRKGAAKARSPRK